jgi:hypothetical protein
MPCRLQQGSCHTLGSFGLCTEGDRSLEQLGGLKGRGRVQQVIAGSDRKDLLDQSGIPLSHQLAQAHAKQQRRDSILLRAAHLDKQLRPVAVFAYALHQRQDIRGSACGVAASGRISVRPMGGLKCRGAQQTHDVHRAVDACEGVLAYITKPS